MQLECFSKNLGRNGRLRPKDGLAQSHDSWILAVESGDCNCFCFPDVALEMNHAPRKHEDVPCIQDLGVEGVVVVGVGRVGGDEPRVQGTFQHKKYF